MATDLPVNFDGDQLEVSEAEIAELLGPLVKPDKKNEVVRRVSILMRRVHSGPLPAPDDFAHYDQTLPGGAERIMRLTEKEQDHRHRLERRMVDSEYTTRFFGQIVALVALAMLVGLVGFCAYIQQPVTAGVLGAIGAIAVTYLKHSAQNVDESEPTKQVAPSRTRKRK